ncbi:family 2 glycoside hydrolase [Cercophora newfieldiana]|uniref:Family 2 glycoside hydrolase n=1 Tax=Cercophora newfieldiana TaxID=92897 RepID=A0AA39YRQ5_9PEZI|nr:family 2 glycoside hydrolase [Cercophora newfieldiana]
MKALLLLCSCLWAPLVVGKPDNDTVPTPYRLQTALLDTTWTNDFGIKPWPQHPRPLLRRESWKSLNGIWTYQPASGGDDLIDPPSTPLNQEVVIPSCIESALSGIMASNVTHMWFATSFTVPYDWAQNERVTLHFEAVDYEAVVLLNGVQVGFNRGGYFRFSIDVTEHLNADGSNDLLVFVFDPTDDPSHHIPLGKQTNDPSHIFYTPCSGIWQTVWLESAPATHITNMDIAAGMDGTVTGNIQSSVGSHYPVNFSILDESGTPLATYSALSDQPFKFTVPSPRLWSPDSPSLYDISVSMGPDTVTSYTGFRTISSEKVKGVQRPLLNGKFVFQFGTLDQGFWPDGIHLPPSLEAMTFDIKLLKSLGMNMMRKHIKIEPDLFYQACDQLGLMIIQDMPSMPANSLPDPASQTEFERQLELMINEHKSYPSIVTWVIYNEGWGQLTHPYHPEKHIAERIRKLDPTRLINAVTGWHDHGAGDFHDNHHYAEPQCGTPFYSLPGTPYDPDRIGFQGEFGGVGHVPELRNLWPVQEAMDTILQTYEINQDLSSYNYRSHQLLDHLREQVALFACSGAVWTQTTDVEGEVNGLVTYDRRVMRVNATQWKEDIQALYDAAEARN